jgi:hypothetical protein
VLLVLLLRYVRKTSTRFTLSKSLKPGDCIYVDINGKVWCSYVVPRIGS